MVVSARARRRRAPSRWLFLVPACLSSPRRRPRNLHGPPKTGARPRAPLRSRPRREPLSGSCGHPSVPWACATKVTSFVALRTPIKIGSFLNEGRTLAQGGFLGHQGHFKSTRGSNDGA